MNTPWSAEEEAQLRSAPYNYAAFNARFPGQRTRKAFQIKRDMLGISGLTLRRTSEKHENISAVFWNKNAGAVSWEDFIEPMAALQEVNQLSSRGQDFAAISIPSEQPIPIAFISDWHIGSWGADAKSIYAHTQNLLRLHRTHNLFLAVLGDMLEMAIRMRSIIEISGNLLPPRMQIEFLRNWVEKMSPLILWATWDNHAVVREEDLTGVSSYAEIFKNATIYHSGLGHTDLTVGDETYTIATSHRFRGRSRTNPLASQMQYIQGEAPDREVAVAGDSHMPAIMQYEYGGKTRTVANCGSLQTNSGYAKRFFSLQSSIAMPVLEFSPDRHHIQPYYSIEHYERVRG